MSNRHQILSEAALQLLQQLIETPSLSRQEDKTGDIIEKFLQDHNVDTNRLLHNIWATNKYFHPSKPSILLNSHHDTVPANAGYTLDPHRAIIKEEKLFGLGSTDAGASLVSLLATFLFFYEKENMPYNIIIAASTEEEVSGANGIELLFGKEEFKALFTNKKSFAIVGEPTELELAIAEKGLLVLDCKAIGKPGHAARNEGDNAIYKAIEVIDWFKDFKFPKVSSTLGEVKMTVTSVQTQNKAHNIIPSSCEFVVDIRVTDEYTHEEILDIIHQHVTIEVTARSTRLRSSSIDLSHPVVQAGISLGKKTYGSPTSSDQALIPLASLKCGPGFSGQSHSADEFIELRWIPEAISFYTNWLTKLFEFNPIKKQSESLS
jgi:acetylornithine deacetylase